MQLIKQWYSAAELADLKLPNFPSTRQGIQKKFVKELRECRIVDGRGGKSGKISEYLLTQQELSLLQDYFTSKEVKSAVTSEITGFIQKAAELSNWQREIAENRLFVVRFIEQQMKSGMKKTRAIEQFITDAQTMSLPSAIQDAVVKANAKAGSDRIVSKRTVVDWVQAVELATKQKVPAIAALAPKMRKTTDIPDWADALLKLWAQPQKPALTVVLELLPNYYQGKLPTYAQAYRFINERLGNVEAQKGRMGTRELKNIQPFIRRDTSNLLPADVYTADGHCFDAEIAHPMHGKAFRPEITSIIDVATRRIVGWSIDLAESSWAVLDAIRMSCCVCSIPAIFYVDNGSGYKNDLMAAQGRGLMARLGTELSHALPYNSQAKGLIERSHQTLWVKAAKNLPTYIGKDMDAEASNKVHKLTRKDIIQFGHSQSLMSWIDFLGYAEQVIHEYNCRPHSALSKITDPITLKKRHLSPLEAWNKALEMGASVDLVDDWDAEDLFRPYVERKVRRGEIELFGNRYFSQELEQFHGDNVLVGYDIHNADRITVRNEDGQFICYAHWNANKRDYFSKSKIQQAREKRAQGRLRRLAAKQQEVVEELSPRLTLEHLENQSIDFDAMKHRKLMDELNALPNKQEQEVILFKKREVTTIEADVVDVPEILPKQRWISLDKQVCAGEVLSKADQDFWEMFPMSKKFKQLKNDDSELNEYLAQKQA